MYFRHHTYTEKIVFVISTECSLCMIHLTVLCLVSINLNKNNYTQTEQKEDAHKSLDSPVH